MARHGSHTQSWPAGSRPRPLGEVQHHDDADNGHDHRDQISDDHDDQIHHDHGVVKNHRWQSVSHTWSRLGLQKLRKKEKKLAKTGIT